MKTSGRVLLLALLLLPLLLAGCPTTPKSEDDRDGHRHDNSHHH